MGFDTWQISYSDLDHGEAVACLKKPVNLLIEFTMVNHVHPEYTFYLGPLWAQVFNSFDIIVVSIIIAISEGVYLM